MSEIAITIPGGTTKRLLTAGKYCPSDILVTAEGSAGNGLPEGYTKLKYIQSSGTQYVNTGLLPTGNEKICMDFQLLDTSGNPTVFGARSSSMCFAYWETSENCWYFAYGSQWVKFPSVGNGLSRNKMELTNTSGHIGDSYATWSAATFNIAYAITLFARHHNGSLINYAKMRLYSCQIYDNGTLARDYVPCRNPYGVVGLYDLVNGQFYGNAGTGEFIGGNPEVTPALPTGYTQVEYIQSSGTQYVNTLFKPNQNTRVVMDCDLIASAKYPTGFGAWDSTSGKNSFIYVYASATSGLYYYGNSYGGFTPSGYTGRKLVDANKNVLSIDGVVITTATAATFSCSYNMYLFAFNSVGTVDNLTTMKLYSCQIYDNGVLVRDYIPCTNPSGAYGLYDLVNSKFYGNAGTGSFTGS